MMRGGFRMDPSVTKQKLKPGTIKRIAGYARPYRGKLAIFLFATALDAVITVVNPLLLRELIDNGIIARDQAIVIAVAVTVAGVTLFDALLGVVNRYFSSRIGESLIYDLRTQVFDHVQRQPLAFFTRAQTGSLVSRLDGDVMGAQKAIVGVLSSVLSNVLSLIVILITLFYLSWLVSLIGLAADPAVHLPRPPARPPAAAPVAGVHAAQRRDGQHDDRAVQRGGRDAGQALRPPARGVGAVRREGVQGPRDRRHQGHVRHGVHDRDHPAHRRCSPPSPTASAARW